MRVAIVAESFLPHVNGVTNSILRTLEHFRLRGHQAIVIAPAVHRSGDLQEVHGFPVVRVPSLPLPGYPQVRLNVATDDVIAAHLESFQPDVIHLASPFLIGPPATRAAKAYNIPVVAVFQTHVPAFTARYNAPFAQRWSWQRVRNIHNGCDLTLVPSSASMRDLQQEGVERLRLWPRGVDSQLFHPDRRDEALRVDLGGGVLVGALGRLAPEKSWEDLAVLQSVPGIRLVFIGDGPKRKSLERLFPKAAFLGLLHGTQLAEAIASMDIVVNPGIHETFCQAVQEALCSGVPVVAAGIGGPIDLIDSSRTGWLYAPGDLGDLQERVRDLAGDVRKRAAMGTAARDSVLHRTWRRMGDALLQAYRDVMADRNSWLRSSA